MTIENTEVKVEDNVNETENPEVPESSNSVDEIANTESLNDLINLDGTEFLEESTEEVFGQVTYLVESEPSIDYTEDIQHICTNLDIIVMVLLAWFGSWVLRSWRTWTVKGGK